LKQVLDRLPQQYRVGTPVIVSATAVGLAAVVVAFGIGGILQSTLQPSIEADAADPLKALASDSEKLLEASRKRFDGRSMYSLPPRPAPPVVVTKRPDPVPPPKVDLGPPPVPTTYSGPAPSSVFGDYVFFPTLSDEDKRIKVGETKAGITVLSVSPPYSVRLGYQRGEFDVSLWARLDERILNGKLPASRVSGVIGVASSASAGGRSDSAPATGASSPASGNTGTRQPGGRPITPAGESPNAAPVVQPAPGAVAEPGAGSDPADEPGELPSAAMQPQRLAPPAATGGGDEPPPPDYVDRALLPQPLSEAQISAMSLDDARRAMEAINATDTWVVDDHSRARLDHERELLRVRLNRPS